MRKHSSKLAGHTDRRIVLTPARADLVDAGFTLGLMACALIGFRTTFSGSEYLIVGLAGVVLGIVIGHLANALRQPMIAVAVIAVVTFFLAGGAIALRATAIGGVLPSGSTFDVLAGQSIHGWKDLLTTLPPVASDGPLIVVPYLLGLLGGVAGFCLARRTAPSFAPVAAPLLVSVAVVLLGTSTPAARLVQGAVFAVLALAWGALRAQRRRPVGRSGSGQVVRLGTAVGLLAAAGVVGGLAGPHLPGVNTGSRTVLRSYVAPPTNLDRFPSPLAGFRKYRQPAALNTVLFRVAGLPAGQPLRIATLDSYNGTVWTASNDPGTGSDGVSDSFQRVGDPVPAPRSGRSTTYTVTLPRGGYSDVWLPTAGELTGISFSGPAAGADSSTLRYNLATGTALVLDGIGPGTSYTVHAELPDTSLPKSPQPAAGDASLEQIAAFLADKSSALGGRASSPMDRLDAIARTLSQGYYSDGIKPGQQQYLPGHYRTQLLRFLADSDIVGNDEQYAAAFALLVNSDSIGIPARVVVGAFPVDGVVRGKDVHAWVQIQLSDGTWGDILPKQFIPDPSRTPHEKPKQTQPKSVGQKVPPPVATHPKGDQLDAGSVDSSSSRDRKAAEHLASGFQLPRWVVLAAYWVGGPLAVLLFLALTIVGLKAWRRRRRRTRGTPAVRLARGWTEILDHARDLGANTQGARTRREQAATINTQRFASRVPAPDDPDDLGGLARAADAQVFGASEPGDADATQFWSNADAVRRRMSRGVGLRRRWWAAVNLTSLRTPRSQP